MQLPLVLFWVEIAAELSDIQSRYARLDGNSCAYIGRTSLGGEPTSGAPKNMIHIPTWYEKRLEAAINEYGRPRLWVSVFRSNNHIEIKACDNHFLVAPYEGPGAGVPPPGHYSQSIPLRRLSSGGFYLAPVVNGRAYIPLALCFQIHLEESARRYVDVADQHLTDVDVGVSQFMLAREKNPPAQLMQFVLPLVGTKKLQASWAVLSDQFKETRGDYGFSIRCYAGLEINRLTQSIRPELLANLTLFIGILGQAGATINLEDLGLYITQAINLKRLLMTAECTPGKPYIHLRKPQILPRHVVRNGEILQLKPKSSKTSHDDYIAGFFKGLWKGIPENQFFLLRKFYLHYPFVSAQVLPHVTKALQKCFIMDFTFGSIYSTFQEIESLGKIIPCCHYEKATLDFQLFRRRKPEEISIPEHLKSPKFMEAFRKRMQEIYYQSASVSTDICSARLSEYDNLVLNAQFQEAIIEDNPIPLLTTFRGDYLIQIPFNLVIHDIFHLVIMSIYLK